MTAIRFSCPSCGVPLKFDAPPPEGKKFHCPKCKANIRVAGKKAVPAAAEPDAPARPPLDLGPDLESLPSPPGPAAAPPKMTFEPVTPTRERRAVTDRRGPSPDAGGSSDLLWKLVAGSIGVILLACLFVVAFWSYIPK
jgi:hypothetical protein